MPVPSYLRRGLVALSLLMAFAASFAGVLTLATYQPQELRDIALRFDNPEYSSTALQSGWGPQRPWGVEMKEPAALVALPVEHQLSNIWHLVVIGRGKSGNASSTSIDIFVNETAVGFFELSPNGADTAQRFPVPSDVLNKRSPVLIAFRHGPATAPAMALRSIGLVEATQLGNKVGRVEACERDRIAGHAAADGVKVLPEIRIDGKLVAPGRKYVHRTDLREVGPYLNYGFEFRAAEPLAPSTKVRITFPDGTDLKNSPCSIR